MEYPKRKHPRLKNYDYSLPGYYYVTIHTASQDICLSHITGNDLGANVHLTEAGEILRRQLYALEMRYPQVRIDRYVIMPTHVHIIFRIEKDSAATLNDIVGAFKSLTTKRCNQVFHTPGKKLFQTSYYETVLRNEQAYIECCRYIDGNPSKWLQGID